MRLWELPVSAVLDGKEYAIHTDFRDILEIIDYLENPDVPDFLTWRIALALFYHQPIPQGMEEQAMAYLADFIACGQQSRQPPGPRLLDWNQDSAMIVADINKVAGTEIRALPYVHWWTFISWFHSISEGQLSAVVSLRDKLARGKKLENYELEFYRENKDKVDLKPRYTAAERQQQAHLLKILEERK